MALLKDFIAKGLLASRPAGAAGTEGQLYYVTDAAARRLTIDNGDGTWTDMVLDAAYGGGGGTVTSVALTAPSVFAVTGSPVTASGTLALAFASGQTANRVLASPDGASGAVALRALVDADIPNVLTTQDDLLVGGAAGARTRLAKGTDGQVLTVDPTTHHLVWAAPASPGTGTVTSVAMTVPSDLSVSGSPITGAGTLAVTRTNQSANQVLAGPTTGAAATPAFRALVDADIPNVMTTQDDVIIGGASGARTRLAKGTDGQVLTVDPTTHHLIWATPSSSAGGTVTSVSGTAPVSVATGTTTPVISVAVAVASGASHAAGLVPDPGSSAGTTKFLREDMTFAVPAGGGGSSVTYSEVVLASDVTLPASGTWATILSVTPASGTYVVLAMATVAAVGAADTVLRLYDGTTTLRSTQKTLQSSGQNANIALAAVQVTTTGSTVFSFQGTTNFTSAATAKAATPYSSYPKATALVLLKIA